MLVTQFTILETMLPTHFMAFRGKLEPASGFQSEQFREIEFLCGLKDEKLLRQHADDPEAYARLEQRLHSPSLHDVFFDALATIGKMPEQPGSPTEQDRFQQRAEAVRNVYEDEHHYRDWIDLCERLTEFDELMVAWRLRHIQVVERIIGARRGTGGTRRHILPAHHAGQAPVSRTLGSAHHASPAGDESHRRMRPERDNITLIGSGLTGPLLAISLVQRGFPVQLYERRPDMRRVRHQRRALHQPGAFHARHSRAS